MKPKNALLGILSAILLACSQPASVAPDSTDFPQDNTPIDGQALGGTGLTGTYFDNMDLTGTTRTRVDGTINRNFGTSAPISGIAATIYSIRWTGQIVPQYSQEYTFYVTHTDGARLMVNGLVLVNNWKDQAQVTDSGKVTLQAGMRYDIRLEFYRNTTNPGFIRLEWQSSSRIRQVVPKDRLFATGSNTQVTLEILRQNNAFRQTGATLDDQNSSVSLTDTGRVLLAKEATVGKLFIAYFSGDSISTLIRIAYTTGNLTYTNIFTGFSVTLENISSYINPDGTLSSSNRDLLANRLLPITMSSGVQQFMQSVRPSSQSLESKSTVSSTSYYPGNPCRTGCDAEWDAWFIQRLRITAAYSGLGVTLVYTGCLTNPIWATACTGAALVTAVWSIPEWLENWRLASEFERCLRDPQRCPPAMVERWILLGYGAADIIPIPPWYNITACLFDGVPTRPGADTSCQSMTNGWIPYTPFIGDYTTQIVAYFSTRKADSVELLELSTDNNDPKCFLPFAVWNPQRLCGRVRYPQN